VAWISRQPRSPYGGGQERATLLTNDRPRTRVLDARFEKTKLQLPVAQRWRISCIFLESWDPSCEIKKGDAGKPALHETLVQMGKEWEGGRARLKRAEEKNCKCRILLSAAVKSRTIVLVESEIRACQVVKNMVCGKSLRRRLRDENPRMPCCDASERGNILPIL
jgi:hypothetical protein